MACCGGCFAGLLGSQPTIVPDASPVSRFPAQHSVSTVKDALKLQRAQQGSWMPSPQPLRTPQRWASPVPHGSPGGYIPLDTAVDFELTIDEAPSSSPRNAPTSALPQLDTDIPARRQGRRAGSVAVTNWQRSRFEAEQLISSPGSLPKPMTAHQREEAIRTLMPTATYQMLAKVPPQLLMSQTQETQELRRQLAKGATVVFMSAGLPGKRFTFEKAAEMGMKCVVIDHPGCWAAKMVEEGVIAKFIPVDMAQSSEAVFNQALEHCRRLGEDGLTGPADSVATFVELSVPLVSRLAERLGLPGPAPDAVDNARNKHATRACLARAGLPTPKNCLIRSEADVTEAATAVGFPAVLKPVSGAASLGVKKVTNVEDMAMAYKEIVDELSTLVISCGALVAGDGSANSVNASEKVDLTVLMEQYLDGCEVDVDVVFSGGEYRYAAVADNGPTLEPYFNETWAVSPSLEPREKQVALKNLAIGAVKSLGFQSGVFHVECKCTSTGPQLIEVNARMGGGQVRECNMRTWGVDLVEETLFAALGIPAGPYVPTKPLTSVAYCYVNAMKSGTSGDMSVLESFQSREGVVWAKPLVKQGMQVVGPSEGLPTWLADLFVTGATPEKALAFLQALEKEEPVKVQQ